MVTMETYNVNKSMQSSVNFILFTKMSDFNRCNKVTGVRWLKAPIEKLEIKILLKPQDSLLSLPKFEDYTNINETSLSLQLENKTEEFTFKWQEKVFSAWELQRYSDIHNCINETELNYHEVIENAECEQSKVFTYIHEDFHMPLPESGLKKKSYSVPDLNILNSCLERLSLNERVGRIFGLNSSSRSHLFRSQENVADDEENWTAMHIVFDNSEYNDDSKLIVKQECILVSLYHNTRNNCLLVTPDVTNMDLNPYTMEMENGGIMGYQYGIEIAFESETCSETLAVLLKKLQKKWHQKHRNAVNFIMPPLGTKYYHVTLEILNAEQFETDDLYVEFHIKVQEEIKCRDALRGITHVTKTLFVRDTHSAHFGHLIELTLELPTDAEPRPLQIFFEVISTDWWGRHRTEGYTYLRLPLLPGRYQKMLSCSRPDELNDMDANERRFFVGGCHLIKDLEVLAKPSLQDAKYKNTTTGNVKIRWNVISQSPTLTLKDMNDRDIRPSSASAVLRGAEAAIRQYKRARARLAMATERLSEAAGDSSNINH